MMAEMAKQGLDYTCLALYLCGDNLYPNIRSVPPVRGEEPMSANGKWIKLRKDHPDLRTDEVHWLSNSDDSKKFPSRAVTNARSFSS